MNIASINLVHCKLVPCRHSSGSLIEVSQYDKFGNMWIMCENLGEKRGHFHNLKAPKSYLRTYVECFYNVFTTNLNFTVILISFIIL